MKEQTIILQFNKLNTKCNMLAEHMKNMEKHLQQLYMIQNAFSVTLDASLSLMAEKGVATTEEVKAYIEKESGKRADKRNEAKTKELESQPNFGEESNIIDTNEVADEKV